MTLRAAIALPLAILLAGCAAAQPRPSVAEPPQIQWGAGVEAMKARLAGKCATVAVRPIKPPFLTGVSNQQQIDCEGFKFFGSGRHAEFVIGDGSLEMVWVMIDPAEYPAALDAMTSAYGPPTAKRDDMVGWPERRTALRSKPAEFLFYSPRQAADWSDWYREPTPKP
jgi:hypothetical protein